MELEDNHTNSLTSRRDSDSASSRLGTIGIGSARAGWIVLTLILLGLSALALPRYIALAQSVCQPSASCLRIQLRPDDLHTLQQLGLSPSFLATYDASWALLTLLTYVSLALFIIWRGPTDRMAFYCAYMLVLFGSATYSQLFDFGLRSVSPIWYWLIGGLELVALVSFMTFFMLFPSGRFAPRWIGWGVIIIVLLETQYVFFSDLLYQQTGGVTGLSFAALILTLVTVQVYRYRRVSTFRERQQTKWVVYGFTLAILCFAALVISGDTVLAGWGPNSAALNTLFVGTAFNSLLLLIPITIAIAMLRSHLWDIDLIISRTLVYGALTACVIALYIVVVGYLGALFRTGGNLAISLVATGLVAVLFQPLRAWLQRGINRLMYGQRDEPYVVVASLGRRLENTLSPEAMLPVIVETLAHALKLPYAAITVRQGESVHLAAAYGAPVERPLVLPLLYQADVVGQLVVGPRQRDEIFTPGDRRLLEDLGRQIGVAVHAVRLTSELQRSRERLVTTREEERRRLRRDLHDGLGPALGSVPLQIDTARNLFAHDPASADALLVDLKGQVRSAIADIRRLVYELRPPALDELGLVAALREQVTRFRQTNLAIAFEAPEQMSPLSAAVEVAIYRIAQEALTNVVRHAHARHCRVSLTLDDAIGLEVCDDGQGLSADVQAGVGLTSMRERAAELGGTCTLSPGATGGTQIVLRLPRLKE